MLGVIIKASDIVFSISNIYFLGGIMNINFKHYQLLCDFPRVYEFLENNYRKDHLCGNMLPAAWEYAHTHPHFNYSLAHRNGIWEENGEIVAVVNFEMDLGEVFLNVKPGYEHLRPAMVDYAEKELSAINNGKHELGVFVPDFETDLQDCLKKKGYSKKYAYPLTVYRYDKGFVERSLPEGYSVITLEDENDYQKIHDVLWKGFDHGDNPDEDIDCRIQMQSGPHFHKDLTVVVKAPNGEYACFCGMWVDEKNHYAYLEPLDTDPKYRRMGLATIALMDSMKRTMKYGATYCYGGSREF
jgi:ribosomal protein S18 acetylase RimI-like enzyme